MTLPLRGLLAAALMTVALGGGPAHAATQSGTVRYPCTHGSIQFLLFSGNPGFCGVKVSVNANQSFTLSPGVPADLDLYFYNASGGFTGVATKGSPTACGNVTSNFTGPVPPGSTQAVVTLSVSECGNVTNVPFTFTQP